MQARKTGYVRKVPQPNRRVMRYLRLLCQHRLDLRTFAAQIGRSHITVWRTLHENIGRQRPPQTGLRAIILDEFKALAKRPLPPPPPPED